MAENADNLHRPAIHFIIDGMGLINAAPVAWPDMVDGLVETGLPRQLVKPLFQAILVIERFCEPKSINSKFKNSLKIPVSRACQPIACHSRAVSRSLH